MQEIETQAIVARQQIDVVKTQIAVKQREMRMLQLTSSEVSSLPPSTNVYEGVGKMFGSPTPLIDYELGSSSCMHYALH